MTKRKYENKYVFFIDNKSKKVNIYERNVSILGLAKERKNK